MRRYGVLTAGVFGVSALLAACTGTTRADVIDDGSIQRVSTTVATIETTSTAVEDTTTTVTDTTPVTTPDTTPDTTPVTIWQPPPVPTVLGPTGAPMKPPVVRPAAAWLPNGVPAPGSMFRDLVADESLAPMGPVVALTFDDGPSQYTTQIVNLLKLYGVPATFFQLTPQSQQRADLVRQMQADGFRLGVHTKNHVKLADADPGTQIDQIVGSIDQLEAITGPGTVRCFRPPYGSYDQYVLDLVASKGLATAMWSIDTLDWEKPDWFTIVGRVLNGAQDRSVVLMHDGGGDRTATILALPWIIQGLRDRGFTFVAVC